MPVDTYGVLGFPLGHSLSPRLHGLIYREMGVEAIYNRYELPPELAGNMVQVMRLTGMRGFNVTMPYKKVILNRLDALSPEAGKLGAVNTVELRSDGAAVGHNTDYFGFLMQLRRCGVPIRGQRFVLCGQSGAGSAITQALLDNGAAQVLTASRDASRGVTYDSLRSLTGFDTIINCTPLGMFPEVDGCIVEEEVLSNFGTAVDIVYNPCETLFLRRAARLGLKAVGGLYMFIFQGVRAFEIWTGKTVGEQAGDRIYDEMNADFL